MIDDFQSEPVDDFPESARRLPLLHPDHLDDHQREVYEAIAGGPRADRPHVFRFTDDEGRLLGPFNAMLYAPAVGGPLQELGSALRFHSSLSKREREIATLVVAAHARSAYEWYAHERVGRRAGLTEAELTALRLGRAPALGEARERIVHEVSRSLAEDGDLADTLYSEAIATLGRAALVELVTLVGYYQALALQLKVFRVGVPAGEPEPDWGDS